MGIGAGFEKVPDWTASDYLYEPDSYNYNFDGDEVETDETAEDDVENSDWGTDDFRRNYTECAIAVPIEDRYFGGSIRELTEFYRRKYWIGNK